MKIYFSAMLTQLSLQAHNASHGVKLLRRKVIIDLTSRWYFVQVQDGNQCTARDSILLTSEDSLDQSAIALTPRGNWMIPSQDWIGTRNEADLVIKTGGDEAMRIDAEGNVGIGTAQPEAKLHVAGDAKIGGWLKVDSLSFALDTNEYNAGFRLIGVGADGTLRLKGHPDPNTSPPACSYLDLHWSTVDGVGPDIYNCPIDGNVGIGLTNPGEKLTVNGNISLAAFNGERKIIGNADDAGAGWFTIAGNTGASDGPFIEFHGSGSEDAGTLTFGAYNNSENCKGIRFFVYTPGTGWDESMRITPTDGVHAKRLLVTLSGWNDYVFDEGYLLTTLQERIEWIKENRRMPEMPSEKEIIENGADVGLILSALTKNTEEIYLYLDQINQELENLKRENEMLKLEIEKLKN